jgi:D-aminopeptidase
VRADELGLPAGRFERGPLNAITDVQGVRVGHATLVEGDAVRTGVSVVLPHQGQVWAEPVFAGVHRLNGNGELTGAEFLREAGLLTSPVALTSTHSVGAVRDALISIEAREHEGHWWRLPVVGETWDGILNDVNGQHLRREHVEAALAAAGSEVVEGNVGGGTGMICHGFKGGIGTASRLVDGFAVGVLVQANQGRRGRLTIGGVRVGELIPPEQVPVPGTDTGAGSIIVVAATDAPLLPHQCARLAQRAGLGVARVGGVGEHWSGDLFLAFATGNRGLPPVDVGVEVERVLPVSMLADAHVSALFEAVVDATEEAIVNALLAAETMRGNGNVAYALPVDRLRELLA